MTFDWYKSRGYLHFDRAINQASAFKVVSDPTSVAKHAFYPFIRYVAESQKIFFDKTASKVRKKDPKERPISYASHLDSHIYSYYCHLLSELYEERLSHADWASSVLAFRALGKSNIEFANEAFLSILSREECCAIGIDVKGFFDNLDHVCLKRAWMKLLDVEALPADHFAVFKSLTKYSYVNRDDLYQAVGVSKSNPKQNRVRICSPEEFRNTVRAGGLVQRNIEAKGIPQGSPISAFLSNVYMMDFDKEVYSFVRKCGGAYYRYCDDVLLIVPLDMEFSTKEFVRSQIATLKLELQEAKTETCLFRLTSKGLRSNKPLQYLGFTFDGQNIYLRSSSLARYQERVKKGVWLARKSMDKVNALRVSRGQLPRSIFLKKLYKRYSYLGRRNFIRYGHRAARIMNSNSIRKQLKPHWNRLQNRISEVQE